MSKRPTDDDSGNGRDKRMRDYGDKHRERPADTVFRLLCPQVRVGSVLGKGGSFVQSLRAATGCRIKIESPIAGCDERVITISAADNPDGPDLSAAQDGTLRVYAKTIDVDFEQPEPSASDAVVSARLLVPNSQVGALLGKGGSIINGMREQTGAIIKVVPKDRRPSCALPDDELVTVTGVYPVVRAALVAVTSRLRQNPPRVRPPFPDQHPRDTPPFATPPPPPYGAYSLHSPLGPPPGYRSAPPHWPQQQPPFGSISPLPLTLPPLSAPYPSAPGAGPGAAGQAVGVLDVSFRLLCAVSKVGAVIGKGGGRIRQVGDETGARVKVEEQKEGCEERVVLITGCEYVGSRVSPAEEALFRVLSLLLTVEGRRDREKEREGERESSRDASSPAPVRLLVPKGHVGCLLGRKGAIINEMRRATHSHIKIMPREEVPRCASPDEELIQIAGEPASVSHALHLISARLRANLTPRDASSGPLPPSPFSAGPALFPPHSSQANASLAASGPDGSVAWMYEPVRSPPSHRSGAPGPLPPYPQSSHYSEPLPPPSSYRMDAHNGSSSFYRAAADPPHSTQQAYRPPLSPPPPSSSSTYRSSLWDAPPPEAPPYSPQAPPQASSLPPSGIITALVTVPAAASGAIIGRQGSNIAQIRSISGARVRLYPAVAGGGKEGGEGGEAERTVEVVGSADQVQAAQALIQAFVIKGTAGLDRDRTERQGFSTY